MSRKNETEQASYFATTDPTGLRPECTEAEVLAHHAANIVADQAERDADAETAEMSIAEKIAIEDGAASAARPGDRDQRFNTWTLAYRTKGANHFRRVTDWTGTWHEARDLAGLVTLSHPELEVWYTGSLDSERHGFVHADDCGNLLVPSGKGRKSRRVRVRETGSLVALGATEDAARIVRWRADHMDGLCERDHESAEWMSDLIACDRDMADESDAVRDDDLYHAAGRDSESALTPASATGRALIEAAATFLGFDLDGAIAISTADREAYAAQVRAWRGRHYGGMTFASMLDSDHANAWAMESRRRGGCGAVGYFGRMADPQPCETVIQCSDCRRASDEQDVAWFHRHERSRNLPGQREEMRELDHAAALRYDRARPGTAPCRATDDAQWRQFLAWRHDALEVDGLDPFQQAERDHRDALIVNAWADMMGWTPGDTENRSTVEQILAQRDLDHAVALDMERARATRNLQARESQISAWYIRHGRERGRRFGDADDMIDMDHVEALADARLGVAVVEVNQLGNWRNRMRAANPHAAGDDATLIELDRAEAVLVDLHRPREQFYAVSRLGMLHRARIGSCGWAVIVHEWPAPVTSQHFPTWITERPSLWAARATLAELRATYELNGARILNAGDAALVDAAILSRDPETVAAVVRAVTGRELGAAFTEATIMNARWRPAVAR